MDKNETMPLSSLGKAGEYDDKSHQQTYYFTTTNGQPLQQYPRLRHRCFEILFGSNARAVIVRVASIFFIIVLIFLTCLLIRLCLGSGSGARDSEHGRARPGTDQLQTSTSTISSTRTHQHAPGFTCSFTPTRKTNPKTPHPVDPTSALVTTDALNTYSETTTVQTRAVIEGSPMTTTSDVTTVSVKVPNQKTSGHSTLLSESTTVHASNMHKITTETGRISSGVRYQSTNAGKRPISAYTTVDSTSTYEGPTATNENTADSNRVASTSPASKTIPTLYKLTTKSIPSESSTNLILNDLPNNEDAITLSTHATVSDYSAPTPKVTTTEDFTITNTLSKKSTVTTPILPLRTTKFEITDKNTNTKSQSTRMERFTTTSTFMSEQTSPSRGIQSDVTHSYSATTPLATKKTFSPWSTSHTLPVAERYHTHASTSPTVRIDYASPTTTPITETTRSSTHAFPSTKPTPGEVMTSISHNESVNSNKASQKQESHVYFVSGPYTFQEATEACESKGDVAATKADLEKAWEVGFNRCNAGWLQDMHVAKVTQLTSRDCTEKDVGVLYNTAKDPSEKFAGVYCTNKSEDELPDIDKLTIASNPNTSVNWWVTYDPKDAYDLQHVIKSVKITENDGTETFPLMKSLHAIYICCNTFNITYTVDSIPSTYVRERHSSEFIENSIKTYRKVFNPAKIYTHVCTSYEAMIVYGAATANRSAIIRQLTTRAKQVGLDGIILNYEPKENYTREHAATYVRFLNDLYENAKDNGLSLGTVISSWGILKYYDIYAGCKVDFFGSMGSTYYGRDIKRNRINVNAMLEEIDANRLQIGLGLTFQKSVAKPRRNYRWNKKKLIMFLLWLRRRGIKRLHIYPGHWKRHRHAQQYFIDALAGF